MGRQAKLIRSTIRMTKFLRNKWKLKSHLNTVVLPSIDIMPVFPTLSIMHVQSTTVPSQTPPMPMPNETQHDETCPKLNVNHVDEAQDQQKAVTADQNNDILTRSKFFEVMENLQKELLIFKPP